MQHEEPWYAICGTLVAEVEVQKAELWAFLIALECLNGHATVHTDNLGVVQGLWEGEANCIGPK